MTFQPKPRIGVAIGNEVLDVKAVSHLFEGQLREKKHVFSEETLNSFMEQGKTFWKETRKTLQMLLSAGNPTLQGELRKKYDFLIKKVTILVTILLCTIVIFPRTKSKNEIFFFYLEFFIRNRV